MMCATVNPLVLINAHATNTKNDAKEKSRCVHCLKTHCAFHQPFLFVSLLHAFPCMRARGTADLCYITEQHFDEVAFLGDADRCCFRGVGAPSGNDRGAGVSAVSTVCAFNKPTRCSRRSLACLRRRSGPCSTARRCHRDKYTRATL